MSRIDEDQTKQCHQMGQGVVLVELAVCPRCGCFVDEAHCCETKGGVVLSAAEWRERCRLQDVAYDLEQSQRRALALEMGEEYREPFTLSVEEAALEALTTENRWYNARR